MLFDNRYGLRLAYLIDLILTFVASRRRQAR